ncbi:sulfatase-like hydrolase/transferase [Seonamhaeicola sp.]|uniref:sulfatase family protein n=1 Tax=Seonamhaeicola sp. TaxID=1912245 RepID=UPI00260D3EA9|nr:sulfatase-like hydrolase/transferase [Seonamhaeicola sp.]
MSKVYRHKTWMILLMAILCGMMSVLAQTGVSVEKPNVIIIYTDDQGAVDMGCYGASDMFTPNMDRLAAEGTRFTQAYVTAPVCAPSRAGLLTGKYPQNAGLTNNTSARPGSHGMPTDQYTMAELFKDNGYATGHIGKWHLGMSVETGPNAQGFDYSFGHLRGCIDNYSHYFYWSGPNIHDLYENGKEVFYPGKYFPDLISDKALTFIEDHKYQPFFMYYAINMPHYPYQPTEKWRKHYKDKAIPAPRADYAAFVSTIDERIGFLLDKLEALKIRDNTIIIYQSDNGHSTELRAFKGGGSAGPYRGAKSSLFEGGIRLPAIISWKANLPESIVNDEMLLNIDWLPTLAALCGLEKVPDNIDGLDLSEMLRYPGKQSLRDLAFWKYGNQWVVRKGPWKLIGFPKDTSKKGALHPENDILFLSNLDEDVSEMHNQALQYPEKVQDLIDTYSKWEHADVEDIPKVSKIIKHKGFRAKIESTDELHPKYNNIGVLLDGKMGFRDYSTGQWIGQESGDLEFIVDLGEQESIRTISLQYLHQPHYWIFGPRYFELSFSDDGVHYSEPIASENTNSINLRTEGIDRLIQKVHQTTQFIKIKIRNVGACPSWHSGAGSPAWVFIDEILIE